MASPMPRAASSARCSSSSLAAFSTDEGSVLLPRPCCCDGPRATVRALPPPSRATAAAAAAASSRPASLRSAVWANPVVSPTTTRMPAPRERPEESSSILRSSSVALPETLSSANTSAMSPPRSNADDSTRCSTSPSIKEVSVTGGIVIAVPKSSSELQTAAGHPPHAGLTAQVELTVGQEDTAQHFRSGDVPVLATPRLIALCEEATCRATDDHLTGAQKSVATRIQFDHLAPVGVGTVVLAEATLVKVEGRRLTFTVSAARLEGDGGGLVGAGRVTRVVLDRAAFLAKAGATDTP